MLSIGRSLPTFSLLDQHEQKHTHQEFVGQWSVIYFYPKDNTPGCTTEACTLAEVYDDFARLGVRVYGVSKDTSRSHQRFAEKYHLPFTLLSDPDMTMIKKYGAFKEKKMFGKPVRGTVRMTYVINPEGKVVRVYEKVDPTTHAAQLLSDLKELTR